LKDHYFGFNAEHFCNANGGAFFFGINLAPSTSKEYLAMVLGDYRQNSGTILKNEQDLQKTSNHGHILQNSSSQ
jgi:hypothetical protein